MIKDNKGITLITLTVAIILMIIIASTLIFNINTGAKVKELNSMYEDITKIKDKIDLYYSSYFTIPILEQQYENVDNIKNINPNDNDKYYVIDLEALDNINLHYGKDYINYKNTPSASYTDIYVINERSHNVYYIKGIKFENDIYYTMPGEATKIEMETGTSLKLGKMDNNVAVLKLNAIDMQKGIKQIKLFVNDEEYKTYDYTENFYEQKNEILNVTVPFGTYKAYMQITLQDGSSIKSNEETIENLKYIATAQDLTNFATLVNEGNTFEGQTIEVLNDIDLSSVCGVDKGNWTPIGSQSNAFSGIFEGNKNVINNIYIDTTNSYQGLFGNNAGTIKNIGIKTGTIKAGDMSGSIVGYNTGIVEKCYNNIDLHCYGGLNFGGLVGKQEVPIGISSISDIIVCTSKCYNTGNITGGTTQQYGIISGIVGRTFNNSRIEYCYNTGNITNTTGGQNSMACGITFCKDSTAESCYNMGNITIIMTNKQTYPVAAGIVGQATTNVKIYNCYNIGRTTIQTTLTSTLRNGGITGYIGPTSEIKNCFWLETASSAGIAEIGANATNYNITAVETEDEMKTIAEQLGSAYKEDTKNINDGFPILKWQSEQ